MAGPRSPMLLCYLDKAVGFPVPRSKGSFPVPVPRSSSSFPVPVPRSPFRFLVPRSGSSFLVYRFISPSPLSEKEASYILGIIYTIIFLNVCPGNAGPNILNSLNLNSTGGVARKKTPKIFTIRRGPSMVSLVRASFLSCVPLYFSNP